VSKLLTDSLRSAYERDGIVFPIRVLTAAEAASFRAASDQMEAQMGGKPRTVEVRQMHLHLPWAYELATHPRILDAIEDLLGPDLLIWATELFAKHPRDTAVSIGWHRDRPYMGFAAETTATAWVALSPSSSANGCMLAVPGPGRHDATPPVKGAVPEGTVDVVLQPGEMSVHDAEIIHGSRDNPSDEKRVGFVIRFITPDARPLHGKPPAMLARGRYDLDHFEIIDPPATKNMELALAEMKESATLHLDEMLQNLRHDAR
jgi:ectoine hydroxylase-related dioxygenase (phytanoyl-CoA dioxygenase family)